MRRCCRNADAVVVDATALLTTPPETPHPGSNLFCTRIESLSVHDTRHRIFYTLQNGTVEDLDLEIERMWALDHGKALELKDGNDRRLVDATSNHSMIAALLLAHRSLEGKGGDNQPSTTPIVMASA